MGSARPLRRPRIRGSGDQGASLGEMFQGRLCWGWISVKHDKSSDSSSIVCKYENGTISLSIQETIPWRTIFNSVAHIMKGIILKSEGHSENQILNLTVLPLWNKDYHYHYYYCYYYYYYYHYYYYHYYHYYCYYYYYYYNIIIIIIIIIIITIIIMSQHGVCATTWVNNMLGLFLWPVIHGFLYNRALADVRSPGAGFKYLYCTGQS